jgi:hypothetical protein
MIQSLAYAANNSGSQVVFNIPHDLQSLCFVIGSILLLIFFGFWANKSDNLVENQTFSTCGLAILLLFTSWGGLAFFGSDLREYIKFVFPVVLGILGGYYGSLQSIKKSKVEKALEYIDKWDSSELKEHRENILYKNTFPKPNPAPPTTESTTVSAAPTKPTPLTDLIVYVKQSGQSGLSDAIKDYPSLKFDLRVICNYWEKIYILLNNNIADKKILKTAFYSLYTERYSEICIPFLEYLAESEPQHSQARYKEMKDHLRKLKQEPKQWNYKLEKGD